jgi:hypothetical protein
MLKPPKPVTTFAQALNLIAQTMVEFEFQWDHKIRMEAVVSGLIDCQCPLQAVAEVFGYATPLRVLDKAVAEVFGYATPLRVLDSKPKKDSFSKLSPYWGYVIAPGAMVRRVSLEAHLISLADSPNYRQQHPKDAALFLQACGL